jgi:hypothetical protein
MAGNSITMLACMYDAIIVQLMHLFDKVHILLCLTHSGVQQGVYDLLVDGAFDGDSRIKNLIQSSLQHLGSTSDDAALYESMLLDVATVLYRRNAKAAVCAWSATDKHALSKLQQLLDCSLVKVVSEETMSHLSGVHELWLHDVIKSIAVKKAHMKNQQCMTRVWLHDQVIRVSARNAMRSSSYRFQLQSLYSNLLNSFVACGAVYNTTTLTDTLLLCTFCMLVYCSFTLFMCVLLMKQAPDSTVVSMIVQSDKQLKYLATNKDTNGLRVLLFDDAITEATCAIKHEAPVEFTDRALDYVLLEITAFRKDLVWLKLPFDATLVTDSTVVHVRRLRALRVLECGRCTELTVRGLSELLVPLGLRECKSSITTLAVYGLTNLQYLNLGYCRNLITIPGLQQLTALRHLVLSKTKASAELAGLSQLANLQYLIMKDCSGFADLPLADIRTPEIMVHLDLQESEHLTRLSALKTFVSLKRLDLRSCPEVSTLDVTDLTSLQYLILHGCAKLNTLHGLSTLTALHYCDLGHCPSLSGALDFSGLILLQVLILKNCNRVIAAQGINTLISLHTLTMDYAAQLSTALEVTALTSLKDMSLYRCESLPRVTGIGKLKLLTRLDVRGCAGLRFPESPDVSTLTALRTLRKQPQYT